MAPNLQGIAARVRDMKKTPATDKVAAFLQKEKSDLINKNISRSVRDVIDHLLGCGYSLESAYSALLESVEKGAPLGMTCERWQLVIMALVEIAAGWNPSATKETREAMRCISAFNAEIAEKASDLAALLRQRSDLAESHGGIENPGNPLVYILLERAAYIAGDKDVGRGHTGYLYENHIKETISGLASQFDRKYWPTCADLLDALAETQDIDPIAQNRLSAAAIEASRQSSYRDFMRSFDKGLQDLASWHNTKVCLSDSAYAALVNGALNLNDEITPENVKTYRAREKKRKQ